MSEDVERRSVRVPNQAGLHANPCQKIATLARSHASDLRIACDGVEVNGKSILELMTLCAPKGAVLLLEARGADARSLVDAVAGLVEAGFGELDA